jgi:hypothetical protein
MSFGLLLNDSTTITGCQREPTCLSKRTDKQIFLQCAANVRFEPLPPTFDSAAKVG